MDGSLDYRLLFKWLIIEVILTLLEKKRRSKDLIDLDLDLYHQNFLEVHLGEKGIFESSSIQR